MKLLQTSNYNQKYYQPITREEWAIVVKRSKRMSMSSIFSKRNLIYKCTFLSNQITDILMKYYNIIIQKRFILSRWLKVLDDMLDKGKGLVLGKLRTI